MFTKKLDQSDPIYQEAYERRNSYQDQNLSEVQNSLQSLIKKSENFKKKFERNNRKISKSFVFENEDDLKGVYFFFSRLFLFILLLTILSFAFYHFKEEKVTYCDHLKWNPNKECTKCPEGSFCSEGKIYMCDAVANYKMKRGKCVFDQKEYEKEIRATRGLAAELARLRGNEQCEEGLKWKLGKNELEEYFKRASVKPNWGFRDTARVVNRIEDGQFEGLGLKMVKFQGKQEFFSELKKPSLGCSLKLFRKRNKVMINMSIGLMFLLGIFIGHMKMNLNRFENARKCYEMVEEMLRSHVDTEMRRNEVFEVLIRRKMLRRNDADMKDLIGEIVEYSENVHMVLKDFGGFVEVCWFFDDDACNIKFD
jgi:hypothetical protein